LIGDDMNSKSESRAAPLIVLLKLAEGTTVQVTHAPSMRELDEIEQLRQIVNQTTAETFHFHTSS